jgi:hypothetical protein
VVLDKGEAICAKISTSFFFSSVQFAAFSAPNQADDHARHPFVFLFYIYSCLVLRLVRKFERIVTQPSSQEYRYKDTKDAVLDFTTSRRGNIMVHLHKIHFTFSND